MDTTSNEMLAYRDIQEIKLSLRHFTEDVVNQLNLLREVIKHDSADKKETNKNILDIEETLKKLENSLAKYDATHKSFAKTLGDLEDRIIDKNNQESLTVSILEIKEVVRNTRAILDEVRNSMLSKESVASMENSISEIQKCVVEMKDKKKNASWWVDWIYKIFLTIALIANFFL